jgi:hypothetical protein
MHTAEQLTLNNNVNPDMESQGRFCTCNFFRDFLNGIIDSQRVCLEIKQKIYEVSKLINYTQNNENIL